MKNAYNPLIGRIMKRLREKVQSYFNPVDLTKPNLYFEESRYDTRSVLMPLYILKTRACSWYLASGGCTMCGYQLVSTLGDKISDEAIMKQVKYIPKRTPPEKYPFITVVSSGSFFDPMEVHDKLFDKIMRFLHDSGFEWINTESRPEFALIDRRLDIYSKYFPEHVSVSLGLETVSDFVRINIINKGFRTDLYLRATKNLRKYGVRYDAFVFFGKPIMTEYENIEDAYQTMKFAFSTGIDYVILMVANIQPGTFTEWLWKKKMYKPPWLWSVLEAVKKLPRSLRERVIIKGMFRAMPEPLLYARNCELCTQTVIDSIGRFDLTGDYEHLAELEDICECKNIWAEEMDRQKGEKIPLEERVRKVLSLAANEILGEKISPEDVPIIK